MIYFFDETGKCLKANSSITSNEESQLIGLQLTAFSDPSLIKYVVSDIEYNIQEIYLAPGRRITSRVEIPYTWDEENMVILGLPIPTTVWIDDQVSFEVTDGSAELAFDYPGVYVVTMKAWPYLDTSLRVEVV